MIVTFCGHRDFQETDEIKERLLRELLNLAEGNETLICYAGGYGSFDRFAARCVKDAQKTAKNIRNCLVIPYLTASLQKELKEQEGFFDEIIYPALENVPPRFAIIRRNEWMVEQADLVIGYIAHNFGELRGLGNTQTGKISRSSICRTTDHPEKPQRNRRPDA